MVPAAKIPPIFLTDMLTIDYTLVNLRKGKPTATWGRKALGPPKNGGGQPGCRKADRHFLCQYILNRLDILLRCLRF